MALSIERVGVEDWPTVKELRLASLAESPDAFWATLEQERGFDEPRWHAFFDVVTWYVVRGAPGDDARPVGLAGGLRRTPAHEPELIGMWVAPEARGTGAADLLVRSVCAWAEGEGAASIDLWVTDGNDAARRLYQRHGFVGTGERDELPDGRGGLDRFRRTFALRA